MYLYFCFGEFGGDHSRHFFIQELEYCALWLTFWLLLAALVFSNSRPERGNVRQDGAGFFYAHLTNLLRFVIINT